MIRRLVRFLFGRPNPPTRAHQGPPSQEEFLRDLRAGHEAATSRSRTHAAQPEPGAPSPTPASPLRFRIEALRAGPHEDAYPFGVIGESRYQAVLREIAEAAPDRGPLEMSAECKVTARIRLEEDRAAVDQDRLHDFRETTAPIFRVEVHGRKVGYLDPANETFYPRSYQRLLQQVPAELPALIVGGWNRGQGDLGHYGIRLALDVSADRE